MEINEHILKLNDRVSIPVKLQRGRRYNITAEIEVRECAEVETDEENPNMVYKSKFTGDITILGETGEIIRGKKKGSQAQKLRYKIKQFWEEQYRGDKNEEQFYQEEMTKIIETYN